MNTSFLQVMRTGLVAGLIAAAVNAILFYIFKTAGVISDSILVHATEPLTVLPVITSSLISALVASLVLFLLLRYTKKGYRTFVIISVILLMLSMINPFVGIEGVTMGFASALDAMHLVVVASLLYFHNRALNK